MSKRLLTAAVAALLLSACSMFGSMGRNNTSSYGDGGENVSGNEAVAECQGFTGAALRDCLDRQGLH